MAALAVSGCGGDDPAPAQSSATSLQSASTSTAAATGTAGATTTTPPNSAGSATPFPANTSQDTETAADGQALFTDVRISRQDGFDQVVWEFAGPGLPGWTAAYTDDPSRQGSGDPVDLPGEATLAVVIDGVGIPGDVEVPAETVPYDGPMQLSSADTELITEVIAGGAFEGYQDAFVGVTDQVPFRIYRLESPTRVVLEVRS